MAQNEPGSEPWVLRRWDFSSWKPHAVVINLGTNDQLNHRAQLIPSYNATYLALVEAAARAYGGGATFFLACGPMSTAYCDEVAWVAAQAREATAMNRKMGWHMIVGGGGACVR